MEKKKKYYYIADILRALAAILVLNSHYGSVYPIKVSIGAELGVAIFFVLSGFLLASINENTRFIPWIIKKELRLFVPLYLWRLLRILFHHITINGFDSFLNDFLSPAGVWFSVWISVLYIVYYIFVKFIYRKWGKVSLLLLMGLSFCAFIIFYCATEMRESTMLTSNMPSKMLWLLCMMLGFYIHEEYILRSKETQRYWYICSIILVVLYGASKIVINKGYIPYFKCIPTVISVIAAPVMLIASLLYEKDHNKTVLSINKSKVLQIISSSSLEIWYVSWFFIGAMSGLKFPINWVCITLSTIIVAYGLHRLSELLIWICYKRKNKKENGKDINI